MPDDIEKIINDFKGERITLPKQFAHGETPEEKKYRETVTQTKQERNYKKEKMEILKQAGFRIISEAPKSFDNYNNLRNKKNGKGKKY